MEGSNRFKLLEVITNRVWVLVSILLLELFSNGYRKSKETGKGGEENRKEEGKLQHGWYTTP